VYSDLKNVLIRLNLTDDEHDLIIRNTSPRERAEVLSERARNNQTLRRVRRAISELDAREDQEESDAATIAP
jgi:hypothetical protein